MAYRALLRSREELETLIEGHRRDPLKEAMATNLVKSHLSQANILYLAESDPIVQIPDPRPTDLVLDGVIGLNDLSALFLSWLEKSYWP